jgi:hypothetical protein
MATLALPSKISFVHIIIAMAVTTNTGQDYLLVHFLFVAFVTSNIFVPAFELEFGLIVIKIPDSPVSSVMAVFTQCSQFALMGIFFLVT